jgi:hypothetical protein
VDVFNSSSRVPRLHERGSIKGKPRNGRDDERPQRPGRVVRCTGRVLLARLPLSTANPRRRYCNDACRMRYNRECNRKRSHHAPDGVVVDQEPAATC